MTPADRNLGYYVIKTLMKFALHVREAGGFDRDIININWRNTHVRVGGVGGW